LHTWDQKLKQHPDLHIIIPAGALSLDKKEWIFTRRKKCWKTITFRGEFLDFLKKAHKEKELKFPGNIQHLGDEKDLIDSVHHCTTKNG